MDAGVIVAIVVGVLILIALFAVLGRKGRERKLETRRVEAQEHRMEGEVLGARADRKEAEAEERAARAKREQAIAAEQAAEARQEREASQERHELAREIDPDAGDHDPDEPGRDTEVRP